MTRHRGRQPRIARRLRRVAFFAVACNGVASVAMLVLLRPGLPGAGGAAERAAFVQSHVLQWRLGWLTWNVAAISLLAFFVALSAMPDATSTLLIRLGLLCAAAGLAGDLSAEALAMGLQPSLSGRPFAIVERACLLLTGYLGNGLYSVSGAMLTTAFRRTLPRRLVVLGILLWGSGFVLSAATLTDWIQGEVVAAVAVMTLFLAWAALVGAWASREY